MDKITLIEQYFEGTLNPESQKRFQELLESDPDFASEVQFQENLKKAITIESRNQLKSQLQKTESSNTPRKSSKQWMFIAAGIAVLIGLLTIFFIQQPNNEKLLAQHINPYPNVVSPIVRGNNEFTNLQTRAFLAYERHYFEQAADLFNQLREETDVEYAHFYYGVSSLMTGEILNAKTTFETTNFTDKFSEQKDWYLALSLLKLKKNEEAVAILDKIIQNNSYNFEIAKELKSKISR